MRHDGWMTQETATSRVSGTDTPAARRRSALIERSAIKPGNHRRSIRPSGVRTRRSSCGPSSTLAPTNSGSAAKSSSAATVEPGANGTGPPMRKVPATQTTAAPSRTHPSTVRHIGELWGCTSAERRASSGETFVARRAGIHAEIRATARPEPSPTRSAVGVTVTVVARAMRL